MAQNADVYKTAPLPLDASNKIRLLRIKREHRKSNNISLTLKVFALDTVPPYIAVSYVWGTDAPEHHIRLQGQPFLVRKNIWGFLQQKLSEGPPRDFYWIDAICIDQDDLAERSHQVGLMGQIYSKATGVTAWLGTGDPEIHHFMDRVNRTNQIELDSTDLKTHSLDYMSPGLYKLRRLGYWRRAWIVQECVLPATLIFQYGRLQVPPTTLMKALCLSTNRSSRFSTARVLEVREAWHDSSDRVYVEPWSSGLSLLECADPRDRIYSQLAIMHPDLNIVPDYTKSSKDLFNEIVRNYISLDWRLAGRTILRVGKTLQPRNGGKAVEEAFEDIVDAAYQQALKAKEHTKKANTKAPWALTKLDMDGSLQ